MSAGGTLESQRNDSPPQTRAGGDRIHRIVWLLWPYLVWILPLMLALVGLAMSWWSASAGALAGAVFLLASPVIILVAGVSGGVPRFVLRRKGYRVAPARVTWLLLVGWWAWIALVLTFTVLPISVPSVLTGLLPIPMSADAQSAVFYAALAVVFVTWVGVIAQALIAQAPPAEDTTTDRRSRWDGAAWVALIATPVVIVVAVVVGALLTQERRDAARDTVAAVAERPIEEQAAIAEERYEELQVMLSDVRTEIAPDGWVFEGVVFEGAPADCDWRVIACYRLAVRASATASLDSSRRAELADWLRETGWGASISGQDIFATDAEGHSLSITPVDSDVRVSITSSIWWGDSSSIQAVMGGAYLDDSERYRAGEWPALY